MTPQELKNSILQLAIQGKLVEQRPEEGTAEELYKQIQAEKQALIKDGKIKKEKPLPEITEEEVPFDIPDSWMWVRFGDIATVEAGGTPDRSNSNYWNGDIPWVKIGDIHSQYVNSTSETITKEGLNNSSAKIFRAGTLLYTIFATIGTVGVLGIDAATNQAIAGITLYGGVCIDYMYHVSIGLKYLLVSKAHGMAQMNINQKILKNTPIPLPPLFEQKRIVSKLEEFLPLIDRYEEAWTKLENFNKRFPEDMQKSILQMAIQGKLVPQDPSEGTGDELYKQIQAEKAKLIKEGKIKKEKPIAQIIDDEIPFDIPKSWKWTRLGAVLREVVVPMRDKPPFSSTGIPWCRIEDRDGFLLSRSKSNQLVSEETIQQMNLKVLPIGTVLSACTGGSIGTIVINTVPCCTNQTFNGLVCSSGLFNWYLFWFLKTQFTALRKVGTGTTIAYVSQNKSKEMLIPLPPLAEQKRIVAKLEELLPLCDMLK